MKTDTGCRISSAHQSVDRTNADRAENSMTRSESAIDMTNAPGHIDMPPAIQAAATQLERAVSELRLCANHGEAIHGLWLAALPEMAAAFHQAKSAESLNVMTGGRSGSASFGKRIARQADSAIQQLKTLRAAIAESDAKPPLRHRALGALAVLIGALALVALIALMPYVLAAGAIVAASAAVAGVGAYALGALIAKLMLVASDADKLRHQDAKDSALKGIDMRLREIDPGHANRSGNVPDGMHPCKGNEVPGLPAAPNIGDVAPNASAPSAPAQNKTAADIRTLLEEVTRTVDELARLGKLHFECLAINDVDEATMLYAGVIRSKGKDGYSACLDKVLEMIDLASAANVEAAHRALESAAISANFTEINRDSLLSKIAEKRPGGVPVSTPMLALPHPEGPAKTTLERRGASLDDAESCSYESIAFDPSAPSSRLSVDFSVTAPADDAISAETRMFDTLRFAMDTIREAESALHFASGSLESVINLEGALGKLQYAEAALQIAFHDPTSEMMLLGLWHASDVRPDMETCNHVVEFSRRYAAAERTADSPEFGRPNPDDETRDLHAFLKGRVQVLLTQVDDSWRANTVHDGRGRWTAMDKARLATSSGHASHAPE